MKHIVVENCSNCPHYDDEVCEYNKFVMIDIMNDKFNPEIDTHIKCPLPDYDASDTHMR